MTSAATQIALAFALLTLSAPALASPPAHALEQRTRPPTKRPVRPPSRADARAFRVGERVKVLAGPFNGFAGVVKAVSADGRTVTVEVTIFGGPKRVELKAYQVKREF